MHRVDIRRVVRPIGLLAMALLCTSAVPQALGQFAPTNAPPAFMTNPTSAMGTVTGNTLVLTPNPNGFVVSGQVTVTLPPGPSSGILCQWTVVRRIEPWL